MSDDLHTCPGCGHRFDEPLSRGRKCPACKVRIVTVRGEDRTPVELITGREEALRRYRESREWHLRSLRQTRDADLDRVRICAAVDNKSFPECIADNGRVLLAAKELREMRLPHRINDDDGKMRCACVYVAHFDEE